MFANFMVIIPKITGRDWRNLCRLTAVSTIKISSPTGC
jgi:hypothetical protein